MKTKYYSKENDEEVRPLEYFQDELWGNSELTELKVFEMKIERNSNYFYCLEFGEVTDKGSDICGKGNCEKYEPRNGKNGICKWNRPVYAQSDKEVVITRDSLSWLPRYSGGI